MRTWYQRKMYDWETRLTTRDTNRVVRPFDWGMEWTRGWPGVNGRSPQHETLEHFFHQLNRDIVAHSDQFFSYRTPADFRLEQHPVKLHASGGNNGDIADRGTGTFLR